MTDYGNSELKLKFTVIIPSYNSELYIARGLDSLVNTGINYDCLQVIVIDDGSKNNLTKEICNTYICSKKINIIYVNKKNGNWGSVINYVKNNEIITGDIVSVLDSDDFYSKNVFNHISKHMSDVDLVVGNFRKFNGVKKRAKVYTFLSLFSHFLSKQSEKITPFCLPLPYFFRKEIFLQLEDLKENVSYQDGDFNTQILKLSKRTKYINKVLGYYYYNRCDNSMSEKWNDNRINALIHVCKRCIFNDAQEQAVYKIFANREFNVVLHRMNKTGFSFAISRKFCFKWFPFYIRWIFSIIYQMKYKRYFVLCENAKSGDEK